MSSNWSFTKDYYKQQKENQPMEQIIFKYLNELSKEIAMNTGHYGDVRLEIPASTYDRFMQQYGNEYIMSGYMGYIKISRMGNYEAEIADLKEKIKFFEQQLADVETKNNPY